MLMAPDNPLRYGDKNAMPAFRGLDGPAGEVTKIEWGDRGSKAKLVNLDDVDRELIIRWLTKDDRVVFGGDPISGPAQR
jgi:hypothetical protein